MQHEDNELSWFRKFSQSSIEAKFLKHDLMMEHSQQRAYGFLDFWEKNKSWDHMIYRFLHFVTKDITIQIFFLAFFLAGLLC